MAISTAGWLTYSDWSMLCLHIPVHETFLSLLLLTCWNPLLPVCHLTFRFPAVLQDARWQRTAIIIYFQVASTQHTTCQTWQLVHLQPSPGRCGRSFCKTHPLFSFNLGLGIGIGFSGHLRRHFFPMSELLNIVGYLCVQSFFSLKLTPWTIRSLHQHLKWTIPSTYVAQEIHTLCCRSV